MFVRIAIIKKMENNRCWPAKRNSCALLVEMQMSIYTVGNNTELLKFARSTSVMWPCYPINNGNLKDTSKRYLPSQIQGRTAYNNKDMESVCLFTYLHRMKYHLCIQKQSATVYTVVSETGGRFVRWSKYCMTLKLPSRRSGKLLSLRE